jgi:hypothetical protein
VTARRIKAPEYPEDTELAAGFTIRDYHERAAAEDRKALGEFLVRRFDERYFQTMDGTKGTYGFASLSLACLLIETLECFYQGHPKTPRGKGAGARMFRDFFGRHPAFEPFLEGGNWFYSDIRCALLHQGETYRGWRIWRSGPLLNMEGRVINATTFAKELRTAVSAQADEMVDNNDVWRHFLKKMETICANCSARLALSGLARARERNEQTGSSGFVGSRLGDTFDDGGSCLLGHNEHHLLSSRYPQHNRWQLDIVTNLGRGRGRRRVLLR